MESQTSADKSISEQLRDAWALLTPLQQRFVIALDEHKTKGEAARAIGANPDTVYRWNGNVENAYRLLQLDRLEAAKQLLAAGIAKAAAVKLAGLDSENERTRQEAATELLDRQLGRPGQGLELTIDQRALDWMAFVRSKLSPGSESAITPPLSR